MGLLMFLVFGFVVGLLARAIMPGRQSMGILMTTGIGIAGSFLGGFLGSLLFGTAMYEIHMAGMIGSVLGALVILGLVTGGGRRSFV